MWLWLGGQKMLECSLQCYYTQMGHEHSGGDATVTISPGYATKEQPKKHTVLADIVVSAAAFQT